MTTWTFPNDDYTYQQNGLAAFPGYTVDALNKQCGGGGGGQTRAADTMVCRAPNFANCNGGSKGFGGNAITYWSHAGGGGGWSGGGANGCNGGAGSS